MANKGKKLDGYYTFHNTETGESQTFGPDDELPDWVDTSPEHVRLQGDEEPSDEEALPVPGPGQRTGEGMTDEEKEEARKRYDRERKARARAAAKAQADTDAQLKAAQEAEAKRAAESGGGS